MKHMTKEDREVRIEEIIEMLSDLILNVGIRKLNEKDGDKHV